MNTAIGISPFAAALKGLLDDTMLCKRDDWAHFLRVQPSTLERWVTDQAVLRPDMLHMVLDLLKNSSGVPAGPLQEFDALKDRPATSISPLGVFMEPTLTQYLLRFRISDGFAVRLRELSAEQSTLVLVEGSYDMSMVNMLKYPTLEA
jgi:hypothetical protein